MTYSQNCTVHILFRRFIIVTLSLILLITYPESKDENRLKNPNFEDCTISGLYPFDNVNIPASTMLHTCSYSGMVSYSPSTTNGRAQSLTSRSNDGQTSSTSGQAGNQNTLPANVYTTIQGTRGLDHRLKSTMDSYRRNYTDLHTMVKKRISTNPVVMSTYFSPDIYINENQRSNLVLLGRILA